MTETSTMTTPTKPRPVRGMTFRQLSRNGPERFSPDKIAELTRRSGIATDAKCAIRLSPKEYKALPVKPERFWELDEVQDSMVLFTQGFVEVRREKIVVFVNRETPTVKNFGTDRKPDLRSIVVFECDGATCSHECNLEFILTCERLAAGKLFHWATCSAEIPAKRKNGKPTRHVHTDRIAMFDDKDNCQAVVMLFSQD